MTAKQTADAARLQAIADGLPPDVHDPATVAAYRALGRGSAEPKAEPEAKTAASGSRSKKR